MSSDEQSESKRYRIPEIHRDGAKKELAGALNCYFLAEKEGDISKMKKYVEQIWRLEDGLGYERRRFPKMDAGNA